MVAYGRVEDVPVEEGISGEDAAEQLAQSPEDKRNFTETHPEEARRGSRIGRLDKYGIPLTVLSALMAIAVVIVWAMESAGGR